LKSLDGARTIPNNVDELQSNRNPLIEKAGIPRKSYFYTNLPLGPCVTNKVITGGAALMLYQR
jgi:hypothetical protein